MAIEPLNLTETPNAPLETMIVDTVGPLETSEKGNRYAVTMICDLTKYLITFAVSNKEAKTVAQAIFDSCILKFGVMKNIRTDCGTEYKNEILSKLCKMLKIKQFTSTPYHHQTVGSVERNHRTMNEYLRSFLCNTKSNWDTYLNYYTYCYNTTPNTAIGMYTPFELMYSRKAKPLCKFEGSEGATEIKLPYNIDNISQMAKYRLNVAHKYAQEFVNKSKVANKKYYDRNVKSLDIKVGDKVMVEDKARHKLDSVYKDKFIVKSTLGSNVELIKNGKTICVHKNLVCRE